MAALWGCCLHLLTRLHWLEPQDTYKDTFKNLNLALQWVRPAVCLSPDSVSVGAPSIMRCRRWQVSSFHSVHGSEAVLKVFPIEKSCYFVIELWETSLVMYKLKVNWFFIKAAALWILMFHLFKVIILYNCNNKATVNIFENNTLQAW